jgi:peroxin-4
MFNENDLLTWEAFIEGPADTPYANHIFLVKITLTSEYPIMPPKMYFKSKIFHPNIHFMTGEVCLDIIKTDWSPTWTLESLCRALLYLMQNPNEDSPLNCDAANLIRLKEHETYKTLGQTYARQYAISSQ